MLESIGKTIRDRVTLKGEVQALTAQQRFSGIVLSLMPVALVLGLLIFNPHYILGVFATTTWCGWLMFGVAALMISIGILVMNKTVAIKI
jgi:tight adherence protein B